MERREMAMIKVKQGGNKMDTSKKRPRFDFQCPYCEGLTIIEPIFADYKRRHEKTKTHYEAWARFWFKGGETGRNRCKIIYEGEEFTPNEAAEKITGGSVNAWKFWKVDSGKGSITLSELAARL